MSGPAPVPVYGYSLVATFPHDPTESTEGFFYLNGFFYESSGQPEANSISNLRKVEIETGAPVQNLELAATIFAEGITPWNDTVVMVTYENQTAFVYDLGDLTTKRKTFQYQGQGWGLTQDGTRLIMSDGTPVIRFFDPATFAPLGSIEVTYEGSPWPGCNELEYVNGEIWANVWGTNQIARMSPSDGAITGWIDLMSLYPPSQRPSSAREMNGIAYDEVEDRIFVTGKCWPSVFQIVVTPPAGY